eukprot:6211130-Prymnesium_polylepis.1
MNHVMREHSDQLFGALDQVESQLADMALRHAVGLVQTRMEKLVAENADAKEQQLNAQEQLNTLQCELEQARSDLTKQKCAVYWFGSQYTAAHRALRNFGAEPREWCKEARLHQKLHMANAFTDPIAATAQQCAAGVVRISHTPGTWGRWSETRRCAHALLEEHASAVADRAKPLEERDQQPLQSPAVQLTRLSAEAAAPQR